MNNEKTITYVNDDSALYQPPTGSIILPNRISIDFGKGMVSLSPPAFRVLNQAIMLLSTLDRTYN